MGNETLAVRLKELRKRRGLSLQKVGDLVGVSKNSVYKWESEQAHPSIKNLSALAKAFEVEAVFLAYGVVERKTPHDKLIKKISSLSDAEVGLLLPVVEEMFSTSTKKDVISE
tara:strand:+ start:298 stop:636 length:339 start_codon:yes stop_codon:yes gene_type:complete